MVTGTTNVRSHFSHFLCCEYTWPVVCKYCGKVSHQDIHTHKQQTKQQQKNVLKSYDSTHYSVVQTRENLKHFEVELKRQ